MSSYYISTQIAECDRKILALQQEIAKLENKIELQEDAAAKLVYRSNDFLDEYSHKSSQKNNVDSYAGTSVLASRFKTKSDEYISACAQNNLWEKCNMLKESIKKETQSQMDDLQRLEMELRACRTRLEQLHRDYQNALAQEEAQRQREAAQAEDARRARR